MKLVSSATAREIDRRAQSEFAMPELALVEAAGRACAVALRAGCAEAFSRDGEWIVLCGGGNNAADALVMVRSLIIQNLIESASVIMLPTSSPNLSDSRPFASAFRSLLALGAAWQPIEAYPIDRWSVAAVVVDGLAGTGLHGPLEGLAADTVAVWNRIHRGGSKIGQSRPILVAIDLPSGLSDDSQSNWPIVEADFTLAIEPRKAALYRSAATAFVGRILPVEGIFPPILINSCDGSELSDYRSAVGAIPPIPSHAYKHQRGVVHIFAGSVGASGAARLAVKGAQAAGAGLVRLSVDAALYPILATVEYGAMVAPSNADVLPSADAYLAGPGWGRSDDRRQILDRLIIAEAKGSALVLDADALRFRPLPHFSGRTVLTPHPVEFSVLWQMLGEPDPVLDPERAVVKAAQRLNTVIVYKGSSIFIAAPDGRITIIPGHVPILATGGSGDVLAGAIAAIVARLHRMAMDTDSILDPFPAAVAATALLQEAGMTTERKRGFCDAAVFPQAIAKLAARAWMRTIS